MELTNKNITDYIDRFMEGETTNEEEQAIYRYFRSADVPKHLEAYKPMFAWYEQGMPDKSSNRHRADSDLPKKRFRFSISRWKAGIAALLVLAIGLGVVATSGEEEAWACYEGSYVEVNGKRITDIETILPIILETLADAEEIEKDVENRLAEAQRTEEEMAKQEEISIIND